MTPVGSAAVRERVDETVGGWGALPGPNLILGGAEAFFHPELPGLVGHAVEAGVSRIALETGGASLTVGENAAGALHVGVRHLIVHYVPNDPTDACGLPAAGNVADAALAGIRSFVMAAAAKGVKVAVSAVVPVCPHTAPLLSTAVVDLIAAGAGAVRLVWTGDDSPGATTTAHVAAACDTGVVNGVWVDVSGVRLPESHGVHEAMGAGR